MQVHTSRRSRAVCSALGEAAKPAQRRFVGWTPERRHSRAAGGEKEGSPFGRKRGRSRAATCVPAGASYTVSGARVERCCRLKEAVPA